jgi:hypothetical protein
MASKVTWILFCGRAANEGVVELKNSGLRVAASMRHQKTAEWTSRGGKT